MNIKSIMYATSFGLLLLVGLPVGINGAPSIRDEFHEPISNALEEIKKETDGFIFLFRVVTESSQPMLNQRLFIYWGDKDITKEHEGLFSALLVENTENPLLILRVSKFDLTWIRLILDELRHLSEKEGLRIESLSTEPAQSLLYFYNPNYLSLSKSITSFYGENIFLHPYTSKIGERLYDERELVGSDFSKLKLLLDHLSLRIDSLLTQYDVEAPMIRPLFKGFTL